jgi:hypothetical protein
MVLVDFVLEGHARVLRSDKKREKTKEEDRMEKPVLVFVLALV